MNTDRRAILTGAAAGLVAVPTMAVAQHRYAASTMAIPTRDGADAGKLEMLRAAVADQMRHEEGQWYPELKRRATAKQNAAMTMHYRMDYARYL